MSSYNRSLRRIDSPFTSPQRIESPQRSPRRFLPASPLRSFGLETAVRPKASFDQLSYRSWDSTPAASSTDVNKPLPHSPTCSRTSSVQSGGSGYTGIIESYGSEEEILPMLTLLEPTTRRDTVASLLQHRAELPWYADVPKIEDRSLRASQSIPTLQYAPFRDERWNASAHELSQAPAFSEFRSRMHDPVSPISLGRFHYRSSNEFLSPPLVSPPLVHPDYHLSLDHERRYLPGPMSASVTEIVDTHLVPQPLRMSKTASMYFDVQHAHRVASSESLVKHVELLDIKEAQRRAAEAKQRDLEARAAELMVRKGKMRESSLIDIAEAQRRQAYEKLQDTSAAYEQQMDPRPRSVSSDSFVIYTGLRESVKAMIKQKLKQKKESREIQKAAKVQEKERKRVMSNGKPKYPTAKHSPHVSRDQPRKYSWTGSSGRASFTEGVSSLLRTLSISKSQRKEEDNRGRNMDRGRRPKQLAVPPSPYQKYGAEVWYAKNKKARKNLNLSLQAKGGIQRAPTKKTGTRFVTRGDLAIRPPFKKKRNKDVKVAYYQGASQLRTVLGVDDEVREKKAGRKLGLGLHRTMSEVRRERLKRSIAVLGPSRQPVAARGDDRWV